MREEADQRAEAARVVMHGETATKQVAWRDR